MPASLSRLLTTGFVAASLFSLAPTPAFAQSAKPGTNTFTPAAPTMDKNYILKYGDTLNLRVLENEKLETKDAPIRPDGRISLPLVGEIQAGGLTLPQFQEKVAKAYTKFFVEPHVVVNVAKFRPLTIAVIGLVNKADSFKVDQPVRLLQAIGLAGGVERTRGDMHRVLVVRSTGEHTQIDLQDVMEGKVEDNIMLYDGDTVRVFEQEGIDWYRVLPIVASTASVLSSVAVIVVQLSRR